MKNLSFNGMRRLRTPNGIGEVPSPEHLVFKAMERLETLEKWEELIELCKSQIEKTPEWLTPYYYAGFAYGHRPGKIEESLKMFRYVAEHSGGDPAYLQATKLTKAFEDLRN